MAQICISIPPPTYSEIVEKLKGYIPTNIDEFAALIGLPVPIFAKISQFSLEISQIAQYFASMNLVNLLMQMIKPMVSILGLALDSILPKIPILNISIIQLLAMSPNELKALLIEKYHEIGDDLFKAFAAFIPFPFYLNLDIPEFAINALIKAIYNMCITSLIGIASGLINDVLSLLKIAGSLQLPTLPTLSDVQSAIKAIAVAKIAEAGAPIIEFVNEVEAFAYLAKNMGLKISDLISELSFPGFPKITLPDPLLPSLSSIEIELKEAINIYMQAMEAELVNQLVGFINSVLAILGIQFNQICIQI
nr:hypothetical protein [uncultured Acinetobacter sp.]